MERSKMGNEMRAWLVALTLLCVPGFVWALDEAGDMKAVGSLARERGVPVMVVFSAQHCGFCERLQADYVDPMLLQREYTDNLVIRRVTIDRSMDIRDFTGEKISPEEFAHRYNVRVTPTVMFFDHQGRMLTKMIEGYSSPAFYGAYLDDAIENAKGKLNNRVGTPKNAAASL